MSSDEIRIAVLLLGASAALKCYAFASRRSGSYLNLLTPLFSLHFVRSYVFEAIYIMKFGGFGSLESFALVALGNTVEIASLLFAYGFFKPISLPVFKNLGQTFVLEAGIALLVAFVLFWPIAAEFGSDVVFNARDVYAQTRTGYGLNYFISLFAIKLAFVFLLFSLDMRWRAIVALTVIFSGISVLFGSKAAIFSFAGAAFVYWVKSTLIRASAVTFAAVLAATYVVVSAGVILVVPSEVEVQPADTVVAGALYSDMNRNAQLVVDLDYPVQWGRLTIEEFVISKIPRAIYPDKPKDFGAFELAKEFFPTWFYGDTGSPAFGIGLAMADFGLLFAFWAIVISVVQGLMIRGVEAAVGRQFNPYNFAVLLSLVGLPLLSAGVGSFILETILLILVLYKVRAFFAVGSKDREDRKGAHADVSRGGA